MSLRHRLIRWLFLILPVLTATPAVAADPAPSPQRPLVIFDQAHGQRFLIEETGELHLSSLAEVFAKAGCTVRGTREPLTDALLQGAAALVISGAFTPLQPEELGAVTRFLERGGRLAVTIHIPFPLTPLLERLGVSHSNFVIREQEQVIDSNPLNFRVIDLNGPALFAGVSHVSFYGAWALMSRGEGSAVAAKTSSRAWADLDNDKQLSPKDVVTSFGMVVQGSLGRGRFMVAGDDALFQNRFLDAQNGRFAANLARWLITREL